MEKRFPELTPAQLDALRNISHRGMDQATNALSQLLGHPLTLTLPRIADLSLSEIPAYLGGEDQPVVGLFLKVQGEAKGNIVILLPRQSVTAIVKMLIGTEPRECMTLGAEEISVLKELANIVASAYLTVLSSLLGMLLIPSIPGLACDIAGALMDHLLIELDQAGGRAVFIESRFENLEKDVWGRVFLIPDPQSMPTFLQLLPSHT